MALKKTASNLTTSPSSKVKTFHSADTGTTFKDRRQLLASLYPPSHIKNLELAALAKQEWEFTADSMPQLICLVNEEGYIVRANRTVERWGLGKVAEIRGRKMHELLHPNCHDVQCSLHIFWETQFNLSNTVNEVQVEDLYLQRYLQLSFHAHPAKPSQPTEFRYGVAIVEDISKLKLAENKLKILNFELETRVEARTYELLDANRQLKQEIEERKQIEADLKKSRGEFRLLVETMSEGLMICDKKGIITYINDRFCEMLGLTRKEILSRSALEFIAESSQKLWGLQTKKLKAGHVTSEELKLQSPIKSTGIEVWAKVSPSRLLDENGKTIGSFAVFTDISARMHTEQALRASEKQLKNLSQQVLSAQEQERQRLSGELHDGIGQTLSAVKFYVETAIKALDEELNQESVFKIKNVVPKIQDAIIEVRRISMALRPSMLDDIGILATLTWFCRESALVYQNPTIQLQLDITEENVSFQNKIVIFRIVQEAFNNAVKHSQATFICISLSYLNEKVELNIEDNGIGFTTSRISTSKKTPLTGLGLSSMRERAEFSGGLYSLNSAKGKGTRIKVVWPHKAS